MSVMNLSLRTFEIAVVGFLAAGMLAAAAAAYFDPLGRTPVGSIFLLPQPVVTNEKEAILKQLSESSSPSAQIPEEEKLAVLENLREAATSTKTEEKPSVEEKLKQLEQLSKVR